VFQVFKAAKNAEADKGGDDDDDIFGDWLLATSLAAQSAAQSSLECCTHDPTRNVHQNLTPHHHITSHPRSTIPNLPQSFQLTWNQPCRIRIYFVTYCWTTGAA
jgi:hypothetical protein